jgi:pyroglutamyl-peptidase
MSSEASPAPNVVWTSFEPFDSHDTNPSIDVARGGAEAASSHLESDSDVLPVRYRATDTWLEETFAPRPPRWLIHVGLAASRDLVCLERRGRNVPGERDDESGSCIESPLESSVEALETTWPIDAIVEPLDALLRSNDLPGARISDDAGAYVCNALYLRSLERARAHREAGSEVHSLFVHVPPCSTEDAREIGRLLWEVFRPNTND